MCCWPPCSVPDFGARPTICLCRSGGVRRPGLHYRICLICFAIRSSLAASRRPVFDSMTLCPIPLFRHRKPRNSPSPPRSLLLLPPERLLAAFPAFHSSKKRPMSRHQLSWSSTSKDGRQEDCRMNSRIKKALLGAASVGARLLLRDGGRGRRSDDPPVHREPEKGRG